MKIYLDDDYENRHPPDDTWIRVRTAEDAIKLLKGNGWVSAISLDNDLGEGFSEGVTVANWMEKEAHDPRSRWIPPLHITVHSANTVRSKEMSIIIPRIKRFYEEKMNYAVETLGD